MSYTELHTGTLHKLPVEGEDNVKEFLKQQLIETNKNEDYSQLDDWDDIFDELYFSDLNKKFYWDRNNWNIYEILNHKEYGDEEYIDEWEKQPNGDIKFITQFYNGGCCLDEAIDYGIKKLNSEKENNKESIELINEQKELLEYLTQRYNNSKGESTKERIQNLISYIEQNMKIINSK